MNTSEWLMCLPTVLCIFICSWAKLYPDRYQHISHSLTTGITNSATWKIPCIISVLMFRAIVLLCIVTWTTLVYVFPGLRPQKQQYFDASHGEKEPNWASHNRYLMSLADDVEEELLARRRQEAREADFLQAEIELMEKGERARERERISGSRYVVQGGWRNWPTFSVLTPLKRTSLSRTPTPPENESTWMTDTSPTSYKSAAADLSRSLRKPDSFRTTDLSPSLQQSLMNRDTGIYNQQYQDNERHLIASLPAWMKSGDHHVAHSIGKTEDGRYLVDVPGLPSMCLDPQRKTYMPLRGFHGDEATATEMVRRRLQGF